MTTLFKDLVKPELNIMVGSKIEKWQPDPIGFDVHGHGKRNLPMPPVGNLAGSANFVLASNYTAKDVDEFLSEVARTGGADVKDQHALLAQQIVEPILQVVPYQEMYTPIFFQTVQYGDLEDNTIPIEDTVALAWETHGDSGTEYVRVGSLNWTRPSFQKWDTAIDVPWEALRFAGWNFLARQMARAAEALARKRDAVAQYTLDAAITGVSGHFPAVSTTMSKASVDAIIKTANGIGFPVQRALINAGTITDMATWLPSTTLAQYPQAVGQQILTNLFVSNYGGIEWYSNPFASTSFVYCGGSPDQIGWHQQRGGMQTFSDIDIDNKRDKHLIQDAYHAWYVGNAYTLHRLNIQ